MATESDLKDAIKKRLESTGDWSNLQCKLRLLTFESLKQQHDQSAEPKKEMNAETRKLNELIFEYLRWNGYQYTAEMLLTETGHSIHNNELLGSLVDEKHNLELPELYYLLEKKHYYDD